MWVGRVEWGGVDGVGVGWDGSKALADALTVTRFVEVFHGYVTILPSRS